MAQTNQIDQDALAAEWGLALEAESGATVAAVDPVAAPGVDEAAAQWAAMIDDGADPRAAIIAAYARLLERLGESGCPRLPYEAPEEHLRRSLTALGVPHAAMETVVAKFLVARFSTHPVTGADRDEVRGALREAGRQLRELVAEAARAAETETSARDASGLALFCSASSVSSSGSIVIALAARGLLWNGAVEDRPCRLLF